MRRDRVGRGGFHLGGSGTTITMAIIITTIIMAITTTITMAITIIMAIITTITMAITTITMAITITRGGPGYGHHYHRPTKTPRLALHRSLAAFLAIPQRPILHSLGPANTLPLVRGLPAHTVDVMASPFKMVTTSAHCAWSLARLGMPFFLGETGGCASGTKGRHGRPTFREPGPRPEAATSSSSIPTK